MDSDERVEVEEEQGGAEEEMQRPSVTIRPSTAVRNSITPGPENPVVKQVKECDYNSITPGPENPVVKQVKGCDYNSITPGPENPVVKQAKGCDYNHSL